MVNLAQALFSQRQLLKPAVVAVGDHDQAAALLVVRCSRLGPSSDSVGASSISRDRHTLSGAVEPGCVAPLLTTDLFELLLLDARRRCIDRWHKQV